MSVCAMLVMAILFLCETIAFTTVFTATSIALDENDQPQLRLNFNITLLDLHCDYVSVDVWDALGTNKQNVTKNVDKWQLDQEGTRRIFSGRNRDVREVQHEQHEEGALAALQADGVHAIDLTKENFDEFMKENPMAFVDMFAPWYVSFLCYKHTRTILLSSLNHVMVALPYATSYRQSHPFSGSVLSLFNLVPSLFLQVRLVPTISSDMGKVCTRRSQGRHAHWRWKD